MPGLLNLPCFCISEAQCSNALLIKKYHYYSLQGSKWNIHTYLRNNRIDSERGMNYPAKSTLIWNDHKVYRKRQGHTSLASFLAFLFLPTHEEFFTYHLILAIFDDFSHWRSVDQYCLSFFHCVVSICSRQSLCRLRNFIFSQDLSNFIFSQVLFNCISESLSP